MLIIPSNLVAQRGLQILSKVLAKRLETVVPDIVSPDQAGFIRGRHAYSNLRKLFNIVHTARSGNPEVVISLDAEKAFDRVEWNYLFCSLQKFGFGEDFIAWIRLLYSSPLASVFSNSTQSSYFPKTRLSTLPPSICTGHRASGHLTSSLQKL